MNPMNQFAGIPGTLSEQVRGLRWLRIGDTPEGWRRYEAETADGKLQAIVSRDAAGKAGRLLWHLSVSHRDRDGRPDRCPTWDEMKHAKYQLIPKDCPMILIFPSKAAPYVDVYATCLHLWESEKEIDR